MCAHGLEETGEEEKGEVEAGATVEGRVTAAKPLQNKALLGCTHSGFAAAAAGSCILITGFDSLEVVKYATGWTGSLAGCDDMPRPSAETSAEGSKTRTQRARAFDCKPSEQSQVQ
jgi:hypothetical protein